PRGQLPQAATRRGLLSRCGLARPAGMEGSIGGRTGLTEDAGPPRVREKFKERGRPARIGSAVDTAPTGPPARAPESSHAPFASLLPDFPSSKVHISV